MNAKPLLKSAVIAASLLFAQAVHADTLTWKEQSVNVAQTPKKLAVYDVSALDILNTLGVKAAIVADGSYSPTLKAYAGDKVTKAGSLFEPDLKILAEQKPDLIIVGARSAKKLDEVKAVAPALDLSADTNHFMPDLTARTEFLANTFGKQSQAKKALRQIENKQAKLKKQTQGKSALMLFAAGGNFMPNVEGDRFGFVYDLAGLKAVLPPKDPNAPQAPRPEAGSPEAAAVKVAADQKLQQAVDANPDYIIVLDRGALGGKEYTAAAALKQNPILGKATGKVVVVDTDAWYLTGAGLANTEFMLDELIKATK